MNGKKEKVIVIGLDGLSFKVIDTLLSQKCIPNIANFMAKGYFTTLYSTIPYTSAPAWVSFVTGVNPGKHGIFDFLQISSSMKITFSNSLSRKVPAIWNILSKNNLRSIVLNVPITYPPEKINGIMVSGMLTPSLNSEFTYPKDVKKILINKGYMIDLGARFHIFNAIDKQLAIDLIIDLTKTQIESFKEIIFNNDFDFLLVVFTVTDRIQHFYWEDLFKGDPITRKKLFTIYHYIDSFIGLLKQKYSDALFFIVSDHGFGPVKKAFNLNKYLYEKGYLKTRVVANKAKGKIKLSKIMSNLFPYILILGKSILSIFPKPIKLAILLYLSSPKFIFLLKKIMSGNDISQIDIENSLVINPIGRYIWINKHALLIKRKSYSKFITNLKKELLRITDKKEAKRVIKKVLLTRYLFHGKFAHIAPDLLIELDNDYTLTGNINSKYFFTIPREWFSVKSGEHRREGILIIYSPTLNIKKFLNPSKRVYIWDVLPTILSFLDIENPTYIDGKSIISKNE